MGPSCTLNPTKKPSLLVLPKVGDSVEAQITSTGDAQAIRKVQIPKPKELPVPDKSLKDFR